jgi:hypothetical protein
MTSPTKIDDPICRTIRADDLREFYATYSAIRGTREFIGRADFTPFDFKRFLPNLFLIDIVAEAGRDILFRYRLTGTLLDSRAGKSLQGTLIMPSETLENFGEYESYVACVQHKVPQYTFIRASFGKSGYGAIERLILPLSDDGRDVHQIIGYVTFESLLDPHDKGVLVRDD